MEFQRNWIGLYKPKSIQIEQKSKSETYGKFVCQPLEKGYGLTIGNSLRRILLSSIQGPAITKIKIDGVQHEFSTITGIKEDVTEIILNLKQISLKMDTYEPQILNLSYAGEGEVTAKDIETNQHVEIVNPDQFIATLSESAKLDMELTIEMGRGYVTTESRDDGSHSIGEIPIDAIFSPIKKVNYNVTAARVGRRTDYEKLTIEVWTNGTIIPEDAVAYSAKIIKDQMTVFVNFDEEEIDSIPIIEDESDEIIGSEDVLFTRVEELDFSARSLNCLEKANIKYLGDLIQLNEEDLLNLENFGKRSLNEVRDVVSSFNLKLGEEINKDLYYEQRKAKEDIINGEIQEEV
ncbi:MAG: DNA-directed RNA polymerase subunit alpha [Thermodesulfobacteriota bacterium]|jgi:DNA-directed RNA polymerase subunit alpha|nr:DNA-directed RNA polymerase subunit alpha [Candidatus Dadabacteria bacterium]|tara:strand:- start:7443 stop:8489 length:1047 start_codon:yes stop_codon:yes gene_type:complete